MTEKLNLYRVNRRTVLRQAVGFSALLGLSGLESRVMAQQSVTVTAVGVKFDPLNVFIEPGDTVNWEGMAGHNVESIDVMVPEGLEKINSVVGDDVSITFDTPGIIMYKCTPHWGARMGGAIVVGKPGDPYGVIEAYMAAIETDRGGLLPAKGLLKKLQKEMEGKGW